jgi:hypothetical protein
MTMSFLTSRNWRQAAGRVLIIFFFSSNANADGLWSRTYEPENKFRDITAAANRYQQAEVNAARDPKLLDIYVRSGIVLSDITCEAWLGTLGRVERNSNFYKDMLNIVGNLILGISGINGAHPSSLARGALALSAANATVDAVKDEIVMGVISDIEAKVREGRKVSAATIRESNPLYLDDARAMLLAYHADCSPNAVKVLLKTSLASVKYVQPDLTLGQAKNKASSDLLVAKLGSDMFGVDTDQTLSDRTLYKLYVTQIVAPADKSGWISSMRDEVKGFAESFSRINDKGKTMLLDIAELRGYDQRYKVERDAEIAKQSNVAAESEKESQQSTKVAAAAEKNIPEKFWVGSVQKSRNTFSTALSQPADIKALEAAKSDAASIAILRQEQKSKELQAASEVAVQRARAVAQAREELAKVSATPLPPPSGSGLRASASTMPVSINAVLVPISR